jgi:hypothetical protein
VQDGAFLHELMNCPELPQPGSPPVQPGVSWHDSPSVKLHVPTVTHEPSPASWCSVAPSQL